MIGNNATDFMVFRKNRWPSERCRLGGAPGGVLAAPRVRSQRPLGPA